jgi:hypothetical protein
LKLRKRQLFQLDATFEQAEPVNEELISYRPLWIRVEKRLTSLYR